MQIVKTQGEVGADGRLRLDVPVELPAGAVELVLVVGSAPQPNGSKYNFADVVGKLQWQGDPSRSRESCAMSGERYLLDTNAIVCLLRGGQALHQRLQRPEWVGISILS